MENFIPSFLSAIGASGIILFFIKRFFTKKDEEEKELKALESALKEKEKQEKEERINEWKKAMRTLKDLSYLSLSNELNRIIDKGFATPTERRFIDELFHDYKEHGWNGDMNARLDQLYDLPFEPLESEITHK